MNKQALEKKLRHLHKTIECGLHSGIPACCVKFYITKWVWIDHNKKFHKDYWKLMMTCEECPFGYIPCPKCLKSNNKIKIKKCPPNSKCNHRSEQAYYDD